MKPRTRLGCALAVLLAVGTAGRPPRAHGQGCAMCKTALTHSPEGRAMAEAFNRAILLMIAAPYVVFGAGAAVVFRRRLAATAARAWARRPGSSR